MTTPTRSGLQRICRAYGRMKINGTLWLWDYVTDEPVMASEMPAGSERWKASERARIASTQEDRT